MTFLQYDKRPYDKNTIQTFAKSQGALFCHVRYKSWCQNKLVRYIMQILSALIFKSPIEKDTLLL